MRAQPEGKGRLVVMLALLQIPGGRPSRKGTRRLSKPMQHDSTDTGGMVTRLLHDVRGGDREALDRIVPIVYDELRRLARRELRGEHEGRTLHPTGLVHEAYVKLAAGAALDARGRTHFLAIAARAMRQVLVDQARRRLAQKRGGSWARTTLTDGIQRMELGAEELLALDRALNELDPRQRQVVEYRFFGGMDEQETADALGVSVRTVRRDWTKARAWLYRSLYPAEDSEPGLTGEPKLPTSPPR
jgi:RNA polymerase sigma-70 factor (ECF subfamily)